VAGNRLADSVDFASVVVGSDIAVVVDSVDSEAVRILEVGLL
jgi:hypothetical protein